MATRWAGLRCTAFPTLTWQAAAVQEEEEEEEEEEEAFHWCLPSVAGTPP
jgi:hypothetical protein